jgi:hypothetical protein
MMMRMSETPMTTPMNVTNVVGTPTRGATVVVMDSIDLGKKRRKSSRAC